MRNPVVLLFAVTAVSAQPDARAAMLRGNRK